MKQLEAPMRRLVPVFEKVVAHAQAARKNLRPPAGASSAQHEMAALTRRGLKAFGAFALLLGGWAWLSPLDSAVVAYGAIGSEGSRKTVQHVDGGTVAAIKVKERALVKKGDELIQLEQVQFRAALEIQSAAVDTYSAAVARLEAELTGKAQIAFPAELLARQAEPEIEDLLVSHLQMFQARRNAFYAQVESIKSQINQTDTQVQTYQGALEGIDRQYGLIMQELGPKQQLLEKGFATNSPVLALQRSASLLESQRQETLGNIAKMRFASAQLASQKAQIESDQRLRIAQELEDARNKLADARERQKATRDVLERTVIRAPASGYVLGLSVHTVGAVIQRGEKILEIVPEDAPPVVTARLRPVDGVDVYDGMATELRVLTPQGRKLPMIRGTVLQRSADVRFDARTASDYFEIQVAVDREDVKRISDIKLTPGTPMEVIIPTGSRTAFQYLAEPVTDSFRRALREK